MGLPATDFDIVGSYNNQRISEIDSERSVNCFEYRDPLGKKPKSLIGTSGLINTNSSLTPATNGFRGQFVFLGSLYYVVGSCVFRQFANGTISLLFASLTTTVGYVGIDGNTFQVTFVDGARGYAYDTISNTFTQITDPAFPSNPIDVCTLDNFTVVANGNTNNFQLSQFDQSMVWGPSPVDGVPVTTNNTSLPNELILPISDINYFQTGVQVTFILGAGGALPAGLNIDDTYYSIVVDSTHIKLATTLANAQAGIAVVFGGDITPIVNIFNTGQLQEGSITTHSGTIVACRTLHQRLFLFSQFYTEVWENAGLGTNLPFRRNNSLLIEYGTPCIGSISVSFDKMFFLSQTRDGLGPVMEVIGAQAIPVSTRALNNQYSIYAFQGNIADCRAFMIQENGIIFYRMNFTAANHTFVYNVTQSDPSGSDADKFWHEEETLHGNRHPAQTHAYFNGTNYVGDYASPILYTVSALAFTNAGEAIHRTRISRPVMNEGSNRRRVDRLLIDMEQGNVSLQNVPKDQTPFVFLSISKDGGQSYGNQLKLPYGAIGQRTFRTLARKLGVIPRGQAFVSKTEFFSPVLFVILGSSWVTEVLPQ